MTRSKAILDLIVELRNKIQEQDEALGSYEVDLGVAELHNKELQKQLKEKAEALHLVEKETKELGALVEEQDRELVDKREKRNKTVNELLEINHQLKSQLLAKEEIIQKQDQELENRNGHIDALNKELKKSLAKEQDWELTSENLRGIILKQDQELDDLRKDLGETNELIEKKAQQELPFMHPVAKTINPFSADGILVSKERYKGLEAREYLESSVRMLTGQSLRLTTPDNPSSNANLVFQTTTKRVEVSISSTEKTSEAYIRLLEQVQLSNP